MLKETQVTHWQKIVTQSCSNQFVPSYIFWEGAKPYPKLCFPFPDCPRPHQCHRLYCLSLTVHIIFFSQILIRQKCNCLTGYFLRNLAHFLSRWNEVLMKTKTMMAGYIFSNILEAYFTSNCPICLNKCIHSNFSTSSQKVLKPPVNIWANKF